MSSQSQPTTKIYSTPSGELPEERATRCPRCGNGPCEWNPTVDGTLSDACYVHAAGIEEGKLRIQNRHWRTIKPTLNLMKSKLDEPVSRPMLDYLAESISKIDEWLWK